MRFVSILLCLASFSSLLPAATIPYMNAFDTAGSDLPAGSGGSWSANGSGGYTVSITGTGTAFSTTASLPITNAADFSSFTLSTEFTVNSIGSLATVGQITIGFGLFGANTTFSGGAPSPLYLTDFSIASNGSATNGGLRVGELAASNRQGLTSEN